MMGGNERRGRRGRAWCCAGTGRGLRELHKQESKEQKEYNEGDNGRTRAEHLPKPFAREDARPQVERGKVSAEACAMVCSSVRSLHTLTFHPQQRSSRPDLSGLPRPQVDPLLPSLPQVDPLDWTTDWIGAAACPDHRHNGAHTHRRPLRRPRPHPHPRRSPPRPHQRPQRMRPRRARSRPPRRRPTPSTPRHSTPSSLTTASSGGD